MINRKLSVGNSSKARQKKEETRGALAPDGSPIASQPTKGMTERWLGWRGRFTEVVVPPLLLQRHTNGEGDDNRCEWLESSEGAKP